MTQIAVGIGELAVSSNTEATLITYALGPCLGVVAYDSGKLVAGLVHCQLPLSLDDPEQAKLRPARYVDTGVSLLLGEMQKMGCQLGDISICVAGAADISGNDKVFNIATRNHTVFRKFMWKNGLMTRGEDIGGDRPRTLSIEVASGSVYVLVDRIRNCLFEPSLQRC